MAEIDKTINKSLSFLKKNPVLVDVLGLLGLVYATHVAPPLPSYVTAPLGGFWLRLLFIWAIIWARNDKPLRSLAIAFVFLATINFLSGKGLTEGFGLMNHVLMGDTYYMKDRARHEADFRAKEWVRRDPNRVSAIVQKNNEAVGNLLKDVSDEKFKFNKLEKLNRDIDLAVSTRDADMLRGMEYVPSDQLVLGSLMDSESMIQPPMRSVPRGLTSLR